MINLNSLSLKELQDLKVEIEKHIQEKKAEENKIFSFNFEATNDPRKGVPYIARLYWEDGKIQRDFMDLDKIYGKGSVTVSGEYTATAGDIIEKRTGGSWKNDYRDWYYINEDGEEIHVADIADSKAKSEVKGYLQGKIISDELVNGGV